MAHVQRDADVRADVVPCRRRAVAAQLLLHRGAKDGRAAERAPREQLHRLAHARHERAVVHGLARDKAVLQPQRLAAAQTSPYRPRSRAFAPFRAGSPRRTRDPRAGRQRRAPRPAGAAAPRRSRPGRSRLPCTTTSEPGSTRGSTPPTRARRSIRCPRWARRRARSHPYARTRARPASRCPCGRIRCPAGRARPPPRGGQRAPHHGGGALLVAGRPDRCGERRQRLYMIHVRSPSCCCRPMRIL